ncbi:hypothetical protein ACFVP3_30945 [Streptomyces sp. NPDC057806]|uniref:hypothetical protein n=1 Tax=Streptomyces sp. NPDC057806 TaxID=3346255 RepID=UPI00368A98AC
MPAEEPPDVDMQEGLVERLGQAGAGDDLVEHGLRLAQLDLVLFLYGQLGRQARLARTSAFHVRLPLEAGSEKQDGPRGKWHT